MKTIIFRFDVDTHKCIRDGVPNLLRLADKLNIKFTFFINLGQAIDRVIFLKSIFSSRKQSINSLSAFYKLGLIDYLYLCLFNPVIGEKYSKQIKMILEQRHEIGIHGGRNHQTWVSKARKWSEKKIIDELVWSKEILKKIDKNKALGFASPGWSGSKKINTVLQEMGYLYVADHHSDLPSQKIEGDKYLKSVTTNIAGEPGGVGYIEHCRASKFSDEEIMNDFRKKLMKRKKLAVIYDHPYYAGTKELKILEQMILIAKSMGYKITTIKELLNR